MPVAEISRALRVDNMRSPIVRAAYEYWRSKCRDGHLPSRNDIDPTEVPRILPHVSLVERECGTGRMRYRLLGSALVDSLGLDATGQYLDEVFPEFDTSASKAYREQVFDMGKPSHRIGRPSVRFAKDFVGVERLYLPLADDGRRVDMVMGVIVYDFDTIKA